MNHFIRPITLIVLLTGGLSAAGTTDVFRIPVQSATEVESLVATGVVPLDVKVNTVLDRFGRQHVNVEWLPENKFITITADSGQVQQIRSMGFSIVPVDMAESIRQLPQNPETIPYQYGWPRSMPGWPGMYGISPTVADMAGSGYQQVAMSIIAGNTFLWHFNGTYLSGFPKDPYPYEYHINDTTYVFTWISTGSDDGGAMGDINGDDTLEYVFSQGTGYLFAYGYNGSLLEGFPLDLGLAVFGSVPALADLDNDGSDEIIMTTYPYEPAVTNQPPYVHAFTEDGSELEGFPIVLPLATKASPAVGDIDTDGDLEIVVGSGWQEGDPAMLHAWHHDGTVVNGFPVGDFYALNNPPALYDLVGSQDLEIIVRAKSYYPAAPDQEQNGIWVFRSNGSVVSGFPAEFQYGHPSASVAVGDINGDGAPEIAYGNVEAVDQAVVYAFDTTGTGVQGFPVPVNATWVDGSVSLADVDGDGVADVIAPTNGIAGTDPGMLWAFTGSGVAIEDYPVSEADWSSLDSSPTAVDIDNDGDMEIFFGVRLIGDPDRLYAIDTDGAAAVNSWPTFKGNPQRTGWVEFQEPTGIADQAAGSPEDFILMGNYPNPFNGMTRIRFYLPAVAQVELEIYSSTGQLVYQLVQPSQSAGYHELSWNMRNTNGMHAPSGVYFYRISALETAYSGKMIVIK